MSCIRWCQVHRNITRHLNWLCFDFECVQHVLFPGSPHTVLLDFIPKKLHKQTTRMHSPDNDTKNQTKTLFKWASKGPSDESTVLKMCTLWGLNVTKKGPYNAETKYNVLLIPISIRYISYSKDMNDRGQHTESSHWAYREQLPNKNTKSTMFPELSLQRKSLISQCVGTCSEIAGERTQCVQLCLQTAANSQLGLKSAHKVQILLVARWILPLLYVFYIP